MPLQIKCLICEGRDDKCEACAGRGYTLIESCPKQQITPDIIRFLELYDFVEKGDWPVGGGVLDQTEAFTQAVRFMRGEDARWRVALTARR